MNKLRPIEVGYRDEKLVFHLKMISVEQEDAILQRFAEVSDKDTERFTKRFEIYKDAVAEAACEMPVLTKNGKSAPLAKEGTPAAAILEHFRERNTENERIIRAAYVLFRSELEPDASFL